MFFSKINIVQYVNVVPIFTKEKYEKFKSEIQVYLRPHQLTISGKSGQSISASICLTVPAQMDFAKSICVATLCSK